MASQPEPVGNEVIATDLPLTFKVCMNSLNKNTQLPVIMSSTLTFATLFIITFNLLKKI